MGANDQWITSLQNRIEELETKVDRLEAWRNWVLGSAFIIGVVVTVLGKKILILLGLA